MINIFLSLRRFLKKVIVLKKYLGSKGLTSKIGPTVGSARLVRKAGISVVAVVVRIPPNKPQKSKALII